MANSSDDVELGSIQDPTIQFLHCTQEQPTKFSPTSIQIIPRTVRDLNPRAFNPRVVSIGPLHKNDENLLPFEPQKAIFLCDMLASSPKNTLETCVHKVKASIDRIKSSYEDGMKSFSDDELARIMVMDACFILELCYKLSGGGLDENMVLAQDMIYDLLLIENQIPFFVLQDIFDCTSSRFTPISSLNDLVFTIIRVANIFESNLTMDNDNDDDELECQPNHILGFMLKCYQPSHPPKYKPFQDAD